MLDYEYQPYLTNVAHLNKDDWNDIVIACYNIDHVEALLKCANVIISVFVHILTITQLSFSSTILLLKYLSM